MTTGERSFLDMNLGDARQLTTAPEGEHELVLLGMEPRRGKENKQSPYIAIRMEVKGEPFFEDIYHNVFGLTEDQTEKQREKARYKAQVFCNTFNVPFEEFEALLKQAHGLDPGGRISGIPSSSIGNTGPAVLIETHSQEYGSQNVVKKFIPQ